MAVQGHGLPLVTVSVRVMSRREWDAAEAVHQARVDAATAAHLERRSDGVGTPSRTSCGATTP